MSVAAYYAVRHDVREDLALAFHEWDNREVVPRVLAQPGFRGVVKYREPRGLEGHERALSLFEAESVEVADAYRRGVEARRVGEVVTAQWGDAVRVDAWVMERFHETRPRRRAAPVRDAPRL